MRLGGHGESVVAYRLVSGAAVIPFTEAGASR